MKSFIDALTGRLRRRSHGPSPEGEGAEGSPVLLITSSEVRRGLLESGLKEAFPGKFLARTKGGGGEVAAVVYEITDWQPDIDRAWLESLEIPVVILTSEKALPLEENSTRRILKLPVAKDEILHVLREMGIRAREI